MSKLAELDKVFNGRSIRLHKSGHAFSALWADRSGMKFLSKLWRDRQEKLSQNLR